MKSKAFSQELAGLSFETYRESYGLRRITERAIQIVSEAARALPEELRAHYPDVPWADIIGIGNFGNNVSDLLDRPALH